MIKWLLAIALGGCVSPGVMVARDEILVGLVLCHPDCPTEVSDLHDE